MLLTIDFGLKSFANMLRTMIWLMDFNHDEIPLTVTEWISSDRALELAILEGVLKGIDCSIQHSTIPLAPLEKGGIGFKVPLFKGDVGGS